MAERHRADGFPGDDRAVGEAGLRENRSGVTCRRCIVTGAIRPIDRMVRCVVGPGDVVVPDVEGRLPGRGLWLSADRDVINTAVAKSLFVRAARRKVSVPASLADTIEALLTRRCLELIGLARRAGQAVAGFEKVRSELKAGRGAVVMTAADGAPDGREKMCTMAGALPVVTVLRRDELGALFGREDAVHVLLTGQRLAARLLIDATRLAGVRKC